MIKTVFVPMLIIDNGTMNLDFYTKAFGAVELRRWSNDDGSIHVAELEIDGAMFHVHEASNLSGSVSPATLRGTSVTIGLMTSHGDNLMISALNAGAKEISSMQDYD